VSVAGGVARKHACELWQAVGRARSAHSKRARKLGGPLQSLAVESDAAIMRAPCAQCGRENTLSIHAGGASELERSNVVYELLELADQRDAEWGVRCARG